MIGTLADPITDPEIGLLLHFIGRLLLIFWSLFLVGTLMVVVYRSRNWMGHDTSVSLRWLAIVFLAVVASQVSPMIHIMTLPHGDVLVGEIIADMEWQTLLVLLMVFATYRFIAPWIDMANGQSGKSWHGLFWIGVLVTIAVGALLFYRG